MHVIASLLLAVMEYIILLIVHHQGEFDEALDWATRLVNYVGGGVTLGVWLAVLVRVRAGNHKYLTSDSQGSGGDRDLWLPTLAALKDFDSALTALSEKLNDVEGCVWVTEAFSSLFVVWRTYFAEQKGISRWIGGENADVDGAVVVRVLPESNALDAAQMAEEVGRLVPALVVAQAQQLAAPAVAAEDD